MGNVTNEKVRNKRAGKGSEREIAVKGCPGTDRKKVGMRSETRRHGAQLFLFYRGSEYTMETNGTPRHEP